MPRKTTVTTAKDKRWNFYVNEIDKAEFLIALTKSGKQKCQSAALRAFMYLYANDESVKEKVNSIVDDFLVYKENGTISLL